MLRVVGTMFFKDNKILIDKPRKRATYQMIGGGVLEDETPLEGAFRECVEELGEKVILDKDLFELVMEFDEIATSDGVTPIRFFVYQYTGEIDGELTLSDEIEDFVWYDSKREDIVLSNTLKNEVIPYCIANNLIK